MTARVAEHGLKDDVDNASIAALVLEEPIGRLLAPGLGAEQDDVKDALEEFGAPNDIHEKVFGYAVAAAEVGYLLGLMAGSMVTTAAVHALPAKNEPPKAKGKRGAR